MTAENFPPSRRRRWLCAAVIFLLLGAFVAHTAVKNLRQNETEDFGYFFQAARAMLDGRDIYDAAGGHYIYPPFIAFVFQPLALLPEVPASIVWALLNAAILFCALLLGAREIAARWLPAQDPALPWFFAALTLVFLADKIHAMFTLGQSDSLMLLGFIGGFYLLDRKPLLAGVAVGAAANIKYLSLICVPYFLLKRQYRAAFSALFSFAIFLALPALEIGSANLRRYLSIAFGGLAGMVGLPDASHVARISPVAWEKSLSFTSAAFRLVHRHSMPDAIALALVVILLVIAFDAIVQTSRARGLRIFNFGPLVSPAAATLEWSTLIFVALVFSPQTTSRHMILLALVYLVALAVLFRLRANGPRLGLSAAVLLMFAGLSFPFDSLGLGKFLAPWRALGGPSWCALVFILVLVWSGGRALSQTELPNE